MKFRAETAYVEPEDRQIVTVEVTGESEEDILNEIGVENVVRIMTAAELLDCIGEDEARKHFRIEEEV